jgi:aminopeptidase N
MKLKINSRIFLGFLFIVTLARFSYARQFGTFASGGMLSSNAAKYDAKYYELNLKVDPAKQYLSGYVDVLLESAVPAMDTLELDLVNYYVISRIEHEGKSLPFTHQNHKIKLALHEKLTAGSRASFRIHYAGHPPEAIRPPHQGGFNWSNDKNGKPWIGVSCQGEGGKIWWPCKDHPSDEPDSAGINITIPDSLYCASNGLLQEIVPAEKGWKTFRWKTRYPINNYLISINIGDYAVIRRPYRGVPPIREREFAAAHSQLPADRSQARRHDERNLQRRYLRQSRNHAAHAALFYW